MVIADLVRPNLASSDRDRIERLRDPAHPPTPSVARLVDLITGAGADVRRLDIFTVERPVEPWLADAPDPRAAAGIRTALTAEVDGGPRTGAKPRIIGGELWFTQSWGMFGCRPLTRVSVLQSMGSSNQTALPSLVGREPQRVASWSTR